MTSKIVIPDWIFGAIFIFIFFIALTGFINEKSIEIAKRESIKIDQTKEIYIDNMLYKVEFPLIKYMEAKNGSN